MPTLAPERPRTLDEQRPTLAANAAPPRLVRWAHLLRAAVTSAAIVMMVGASAIALLSEPQVPADSRLDLSTSGLNRMFEHNRCSVTGFGNGVIPARAMIRRESGETAMVSFDRGWDVFSGKRPGELMAVCLGPEVRGKR